MIEKEYFVMNKGKSLWIQSVDLSAETRICRYMGFDVFLQILEGRLFVPRKKLFLDARESGKISNQWRFACSLFDKNNEKTSDKVVEEQSKIDEHVDNLKKSRYLLTSCWTFDNGEDYMMWMSYAPTIGVCVQTTIGDLLNSIEYDKYDYIPICSPMLYGNVSIRKNSLESFFTKDKFYKSEREMRIYFVPKSEINKFNLDRVTNSDIESILLNASVSEKRMCESKTSQSVLHKYFDIQANFIKSIILSPQIKSGTISCFRKLLREQYNNIFTSDNMIKTSQIEIR